MERLQKVIANAGLSSRRKAEKLILEGRVQVNGERVTTLGVKVSRSDKIEVDGQPIYREAKKYYLFNKPTGVISAVSDDRGRSVVTDYFPEDGVRIYPIGRLDYNTSGLLLLTNDGEFANLLMHPRYGIEKTYIAKVNGLIQSPVLKKLARGVVIDGKKTGSAKVKCLKRSEAKAYSIVQITIHEGRNRQVRKMFEAVGHTVQKLRRSQYGPLSVENMALGSYRALKPQEIKALRDLAGHLNNK